MKKRIVALMVLALLSFGYCFEFTVSADTAADLVVDNANILTDGEEKELKTLLEDIRAKHRIDVVILTVESLEYGKSPMETADDYYDYNGYSDNGMLLLLSMEERDWWFSTSGTCITKMTDKVCDGLESRFLPKFKKDDYASGFKTFAKDIEKYYTDGKIPKKPFNFKVWIPVALAAGLLVGFGVTSSMKSQLLSVKLQRDALGYAVNGSMSLEQSTETFLYSTVTKTPKPRDTGGSGSGGGSHRSSSGRSHGGRGGKF